MDRRHLLLATGAALATATVVAKADQHDHEHHHGHGVPALVTSTSHCVATANVCLAHCLDRLADGDASMAACARSVTGLIAACNALLVLAAQQSKHLAKYAAVTADLCRSCEEECRKHAEHPPCEACAEACKACAAECAKVAT